MWRPPALLAIAFLTGVGTCTSSLVPTTPSPGRGVLPPTNPPWAPTYNLSLSTIGMMINFTGWSPPEYGGKFGIVSYDWSTAKLQWAAAKPMDCEERLQTQARMTKAYNPASHVFVYRNLIKALPWFASVREKLEDPAYAGWFLKFDINNTAVPRCAPEDPSKCSALYHDQVQTPEVPTEAQPSPDGVCTDNTCDCGAQPCGEYYFDHRNGSSLRDWIVNELIGGKRGLGDPAISGFFLDDAWCSDKLCQQLGCPMQGQYGCAGCKCNHPQGASEGEEHQLADMGLSDDDVADITSAWNATMGAVQQYILDHGGYTWSLIPGQANANAMPLLMNKTTCAATLREACRHDSRWQQFSTLFGLNKGKAWTSTTLTQLDQDLAYFLLARGPYAWLGWGKWGMDWPSLSCWSQQCDDDHIVPLPAQLTAGGLDVGEPLGICTELGSSGVFVRNYSKVQVQLDCGQFVGKITPKA